MARKYATVVFGGEKGQQTEAVEVEAASDREAARKAVEEVGDEHDLPVSRVLVGGRIFDEDLPVIVDPPA